MEQMFGNKKKKDLNAQELKEYKREQKRLRRA